MMQHVLFACDFSPSSERALRYGVDLVERTGASLHFVHVQEVPMGPFVEGDPSPEPGDQQLQKQFVRRCREDLEACSFAPDEERLSFVTERSGAVAPALVDYAEENDVDLVVMGTQGRRGISRAVFGSVAEEVLRTAPCPVMTVREAATEGKVPPESGSIGRIVVPIDFSDPSRNALNYAARLATLYEVPMTLAHVVQLPKIPTVYQVELSGLSVEDVEAKVQTKLEEWGRSVATNGPSIDYVVESGDPIESILSVASAPSDLVVMATRGMSGLKRTMLGSVAEGVLRRARGPVLSARVFPEKE